jgi:hypothetical protein
VETILKLNILKLPFAFPKEWLKNNKPTTNAWPDKKRLF